MLKSCPYCGMIHPAGFICPKKPERGKKRSSKADHFRKSWAWQRKRIQILKRDFYLCRACNAGGYGVLGVPGVNQDLSVHHIEPLEERFDLRLEDDNWVTCCSRHHEMAEAGKIPREYLHALAQVSPRWGAITWGGSCQDRLRPSGHKEV